jgi:ribonuclease HII
MSLQKYFVEDPTIYEIGVDEAGRGPLFGRVYAGAVVLPKDDTFDHSKMKDSKKFHSKKKITEVAEYIEKNALAWSVNYLESEVIDEMNILQATMECMKTSILCCKKQLEEKYNNSEKMNLKQLQLLVDGNLFNPITEYDKINQKIVALPHICIEGGDNKYSAIAAASILAKVHRDKYIEDLCVEHPELSEKYSIDSNKGYGAKKHIDGIKQHGITQWHRKSFGICKNY